MRTFLIYLAVIGGLCFSLVAGWPRDPWERSNGHFARPHDYSEDICGLLGAVAFLSIPYLIAKLLLELPPCTPENRRPIAPLDDVDPAKQAAAALGFDIDTDDIDGSTPVFDAPARRVRPLPPITPPRFALFRCFTAGIVLACTLGVAAPSLVPESAAARFLGCPFPAFSSPGLPPQPPAFYPLGLAFNIAIFSCLYLAAASLFRKRDGCGV